MEYIFRIAFVGSLLFLSFLAGAFIAIKEVFPYPYLKRAYDGAHAFFEQQTQYSTPYDTNLWTQTRLKAKGVTRYDANRAYNGLTLYTTGHAQQALLVDMEGRVIHKWELPFSKIWPNPPHVKKPVGDEFIYWRKALLYPNGDLLAIYIALGDTPWGYGLVKVDKDSRLVWKYPERVHHDMAVGPEGEIYTLTHEILSEPIPGLPFPEPYMDDMIDVISPDGKLLKRVSLLKAIRDSEFRTHLLSIIPNNSKGDILHCNTVELVDEQAARAHPYLKEGQVVISARNIDTLLAVDLDKEVVVWVLRGPWRAQHDPDLLNNGNILIFDNKGHQGPEGDSRVIEVNPETLEIRWAYAGTSESPFFSELRSAQQRLANGNTLITESDGGRIFEVTPDHEIVWEYINPQRGGENSEMIPVVSWAQRFRPEQLTFLEDGP